MNIFALLLGININVPRGVYKLEDLVEKSKVEDTPSKLAIIGRYILAS